MSEDRAIKRAEKALDTIIDDQPAWDAMLGIVYARALRDEIVMARLRKGLRQVDLAVAMDIPQSQVSEFETARYPDPRLSTLRRYYLALGMHVGGYELSETVAGLKARLKAEGKSVD